MNSPSQTDPTENGEVEARAENHPQKSLGARIAQKVKNGLIFYLSLPIMVFINILPFSWVGALGRAFGLAFFRLVAGERRNTLANLRTAFPQMEEEELFRLARAIWKGLGQNLFEVIHWITFSRKRWSPGSPASKAGITWKRPCRGARGSSW